MNENNTLLMKLLQLPGGCGAAPCPAGCCGCFGVSLGLPLSPASVGRQLA